MDKKKENPKKIEKTTSIRGLEETNVPYTFNLGGIEKPIFSNEAGVNLETLYEILNASPEVVGCLNAIVEDIMADEYRFDGSKSAAENANKFSIDSDFYKIISNAVLDLLLTGNAYILKLSVNEEKIKEIVRIMTKELKKELFSKQKGRSIMQVIKQANFKKPVDLQLLKSSTIKINFDETGLKKSYQQQVNGKTRVYYPQDVIHISLLNVGGQPYGFTPLETLLADLGTLIFAKNYAGKYFENDGVPNFMFNLPEANPDDRNYENLKKELKELKNSANKFRSLVTTGKIDAKELKKFDKDMEYSKLIQHFTQIILIALGVPAHRINYTIDVKDTSAQNIGKIETGYYKKISFYQKIIENKLNKELWKDFAVKMKFKRSYKIDEMREATIVQILTQIGAITIEEAREMMGLDPAIPKGTTPNKTGDNNRPDFSQDKKQEQGIDNSPKPDQNVDNRVKEMTKSFSDYIDVDWTTFVRVVEKQAGPGNFDKAKVLYFETDESFVLLFNDNSWKYKTNVSKSSIDPESFMVEYLQFAIKIII